MAAAAMDNRAVQIRAETGEWLMLSVAVANGEVSHERFSMPSPRFFDIASSAACNSCMILTDSILPVVHSVLCERQQQPLAVRVGCGRAAVR
jgi:hypothetical protein